MKKSEETNKGKVHVSDLGKKKDVNTTDNAKIVDEKKTKEENRKNSKEEDETNKDETNKDKTNKDETNKDKTNKDDKQKKQNKAKKETTKTNTKEQLIKDASHETKKGGSKNPRQDQDKNSVNQTKTNNNNPENNKKSNENKLTDEVDNSKNGVYVERIINVEISEKVKTFIRRFIENREEILNWCNKNPQIYTNKINEKTTSIFFHDTENLNKILKEDSVNIDFLSIIIYFYNLYCTHNNKEKVNFNDLMTNSHITYRGLYENIDTNSKTFKNLLHEERKYKLQSMKKGDDVYDSFWNYKKTYPYGINLILGIFLTFISGYYGALLLGYNEFTTRLICGVIFSYIGLILEVFIYIIIYEKTENIKKKRLKALERYNGLYKKIRVASDKYRLGNRSQISVYPSSSLSTGGGASSRDAISKIDQEETKKDK